MTALFLGAAVPGSPEWRTIRAGAIGGSDIAAVLGLSRWQSRFSLWHELEGMVAPEPERPVMDWGKRLEPLIVDAFREFNPDLNVSRALGAMYAHPDRLWQLASPDALILGPRGVCEDVRSGLEVKTSRHPDEWGRDGTDQIPPYYRCQVQWCMDVFGVDRWYVALLCSGSDYRQYTIHADPTDQELMRDAAREFLRTLRDNERPDIDDHSRTYDVVRELHPSIDPDAGPFQVPRDLAAEFCNARRAKEAATDLCHGASARLLEAMGAARVAEFDGRAIAYRQSKGGAVPHVVAARHLPHITPTEDTP